MTIRRDLDSPAARIDYLRRPAADLRRHRRAFAARGLRPHRSSAQVNPNDSFGNVIATSGSIANNFRYTGRKWDAETSLYYYRARYYDAAIGRFFSEDPLRFFAGEVNFYAYVEQNPINLVDPRGLVCQCSYSQSTGHLKSVDEVALSDRLLPVPTDMGCLHVSPVEAEIPEDYDPLVLIVIVNACTRGWNVDGIP